MSWTNGYLIRCDRCGRFCGYQAYDEETPFGCADYDNPEPFEPSHYCKLCAVKLYEDYLKAFRRGCRSGNWRKSDAEIRAAKKCGLQWVHDTPKIDPETGEEVTYRYILCEEERNVG